MRLTADGLLMLFALVVLGITRATAEKPQVLTPPSGQANFFESKVRPLLITRCLDCHSGEDINGGLDLSSASGWQAGGDSGSAIDLAQPEKSLLLKAIRYEDLHLQMPPDGKLPQAEIDVFAKWIQLGAYDPRVADPAHAQQDPAERYPELLATHWAYQPISDKLPLTTTIDDLLFTQEPASPPASHEVLVRRLYFDLTGLPPTPSEFDAGLQLLDAGQFETLVDDLLARKSSAEHFARRYFDIVRFAESITLRGLMLPHAWRYRDYVVESLHADRPLDEFIFEQIAGDLMEPADSDTTSRRRIASTFLALGNHNWEEQDKKQLDMDVVDEQLNTIGQAFLGQTFGCARCHDHKFDPITAQDYYAMAGIFKHAQVLDYDNVSKPIVEPLPVDDEQVRLFEDMADRAEELNLKIEQLKKREESRNADSAFMPTLDSLNGLIVDDTQAVAIGAWTHSTHSKPYLGDGYLHDANEDKGNKTLTFTPMITQPGEYEVFLGFASFEGRAARVPITLLHSRGEETLYVDQTQAPSHWRLLHSLGTYHFDVGNQGYVMISNENTEGYVIADAVVFVPKGTKLTKQTQATDAPSTPANKELAKLKAELNDLKLQLKTRPHYLTVRERVEKSNCAIHIRGSVHSLGEEVPRGVPRVGMNPAEAHQFNVPAEVGGRLQFAEWIVSEKNTLTARVFANRVWLWIMGEGLVRTPDNFGTTGELPAHPELLDLLARQLIGQNWSLKSLVKRIVLSQAYQQTSSPDATLLASDPENKAWRYALRKKLTAEQIRDAMLAISGQLDLSQAGPPPSLNSDFGYVPDQLCRSLYVPVFRNALPDLFVAFDFPEPSYTAGKRNQSIIPTQSLFLLNSPFVSEQARATSARLLSTPDQDLGGRIDEAYRLILSRSPTPAERSLALQLLSGSNQDDDVRWSEFVHALLASPDFRYLD